MFQGLSEDILNMCIQSLTSASQKIVAEKVKKKILKFKFEVTLKFILKFLI